MVHIFLAGKRLKKSTKITRMTTSIRSEEHKNQSDKASYREKFIDNKKKREKDMIYSKKPETL